MQRMTWLSDHSDSASVLVYYQQGTNVLTGQRMAFDGRMLATRFGLVHMAPLQERSAKRFHLLGSSATVGAEWD